MLWYPQTLVFIFHGHAAVQMRDSQLLHAKDTDQLRREGISGECPAHPLLEAEAAAAACSEQCPAGFSVSQRMRPHKLTGQFVPEFGQSHHKKAFYPLYFIFVPRACTSLWQMCAVPCLGEWCSTGGHKEVPAAPASCPVGNRALGSSRHWCLLFPHVCGELEAFSIQRKRQHNLVILHGNSVREVLSGFLLKIRSSKLQYHFWGVGGNVLFQVLCVQVMYQNVCSSVGNIQNYSYKS